LIFVFAALPTAGTMRLSLSPLKLSALSCQLSAMKNSG